MLDRCGRARVNQRTIVWLAQVQGPSLSCSHILEIHGFPRDTLGTSVLSLAFSSAAHFLLTHAP